jgi:hypothetical protein
MQIFLLEPRRNYTPDRKYKPQLEIWRNQNSSKTPIVGKNYSKEGLIIGLQHNS